MQYKITATCVSHPKNRNGNVVFVGNAARFKTSTGIFTAAIITHNTKLLLPKHTMLYAVSGKVNPICSKKASASNKKLLRSCAAHKFKNLEKTLV